MLFTLHNGVNSTKRKYVVEALIKNNLRDKIFLKFLRQSEICIRERELTKNAELWFKVPQLYIFLCNTLKSKR